MLENYAVPVITNGGANSSVIFQQDGAAPHYAKIVRDYLDEALPLRWCGRGGGVGGSGDPVNYTRGCLEWPARSPDLTPLDFFLWGYVKNIVYQEQIYNIDQLKARIVDGFVRHPISLDVYCTLLTLCSAEASLLS